MATNQKKSPNASRGASRSTVSGRPAGLFFWVAIIAVVAVVAVIVIIKVSSSSPSSSGQQSKTWTPVSTQVASELAGVPLSTFNAVGISASVTTVTVPDKVSAPALNWVGIDGVKRPTVFYYGAEYCPYCAAERWAIIVALSRFGTFTGLGNMSSSSLDKYANTPTFTFIKAKYTSSYINFSSVEAYNNIYDAKINFYSPLQKPNAEQNNIFNKYDTVNYIPGLSQNGSIPFVDFNGKWLIGGAQYGPDLLDGNSRTKIASELADPNSLLAQPVIASANLITAAICNMDGDAPSNVCTSSGVKAANAAMGIKH